MSAEFALPPFPVSGVDELTELELADFDTFRAVALDAVSAHEHEFPILPFATADDNGRITELTLRPALPVQVRFADVANARRNYTDDQIAKAALEAISNYYGVSVEQIIGHRRTKELVTPRNMAYLLLREMTELSYPRIARYFDGRDHTTIISGVKNMASKIENEPTLRKDHLKLQDDTQQHLNLHEALSPDADEQQRSRMTVLEARGLISYPVQDYSADIRPPFKLEADFMLLEKGALSTYEMWRLHGRTAISLAGNTFETEKKRLRLIS